MFLARRCKLLVMRSSITMNVAFDIVRGNQACMRAIIVEQHMWAAEARARLMP